MTLRFNLSQCIEDIQPFHVMDILQKAKILASQGREIIHMEVGEPSFSTPLPILQAGMKALSQDLTKYTPAKGLLPLLEAIKNHYLIAYQTQIALNQIVVTPGASGAILAALALILNEGEGVICTDPGYPCNRHIVSLLKGKALSVYLREENNYQIQQEALDQLCTVFERENNKKVRALLLASPSNPLGVIISPNEWKSLVLWAEKNKVMIISDEIYQGLHYDEPAHSALEFSSNVIVINSFSKYFGMTGWRLGWLVVPPYFSEKLDRLVQNVFLAPNTVSQYAACAAFTEDTKIILEERRLILKANRDFLCAELTLLGFHFLQPPMGAFYVYVDVSKWGLSGEIFCQRALNEAGVALTPGIDFGFFKAENKVRFSFAGDFMQIKKGLEKLTPFLEKLTVTCSDHS